MLNGGPFIIVDFVPQVIFSLHFQIPSLSLTKNSRNPHAYPCANGRINERDETKDETKEWLVKKTVSLAITTLN